MQKNFILLSFLLLNNCNAAEELEKIESYDISSTPKTSTQSFDNSLVSCQECNSDELNIMEEYDRNVTDNVTSPTVSNIEVVFRNIAGSLLLRYIQLREKTHYYVEKMKNNFSRLYAHARNYFR